MDKPDGSLMNDDTRDIDREFKGNPYRNFNIAFSLMMVIPFLAFFYALIKAFSFDLMVGETGLVIFVAVLISLVGYFTGYRMLKKVIDKVMMYAAISRYRDEQKSEFVAFVSHELKTPLSVMKMNMTNMRMGILGTLTDPQKNIMNVCLDMIRRMTRLITTMLDLYKIESGMIKCDKKVCNLREVIDGQINEFMSSFESRNITFVRDVDDDLTVNVDIPLMTQVVNNILSNAAKFTPDRGKVTFKTGISDVMVKMGITNTCNAPGYEELPRIFKKFERMDLSKEGSGIGLAVSKDIVELHDGKIWADTKPGKELTFTVLLPRHVK